MVEQKGIQQQMWKSLLTTFLAPPLWRCRRRLSVPPPPLLRWLARAVDLLSQLSFLIEICLSLFCSHSSQIIANQMRYRIQKLTLFTKIPFIILSKHLGEEGFHKKHNSTTSLNLYDCRPNIKLIFQQNVFFADLSLFHLLYAEIFCDRPCRNFCQYTPL